MHKFFQTQPQKLNLFDNYILSKASTNLFGGYAAMPIEICKLTLTPSLVAFVEAFER
jgi:hypothetical protein